MDQPRKGRNLRLTPARKMVLELLHHARKVPSLPLARTMHVGDVVQARRQGPAPSWTAIFMKAYGIVAQRFPELRRAFIPMPWRHLYEHPFSECAVLIERDWEGEGIVLGAKIRAPENQPLVGLDGHLRYFREAPVLEVNYFRQTLRLGRLPGVLRRFTVWHTLYLSGFKRAKRVGTFMLSSLGNLGIEQFHPLTPLTTYLTYGPISSAGEVTAKIIYDHRVMDGRVVGRCLNELETVLNGPILREIRERQQREAA